MARSDESGELVAVIGDSATASDWWPFELDAATTAIPDMVVCFAAA